MIAVPVMNATLRVPLDGGVPPGQEAFLVRGDARPFALVGRWADGSALVGSEPVEIAGEQDDPFALLGRGSGSDETRDAPEGFVGGGWFGYLGFDLGAPGEDPVPGPPSRERAPGFMLARYDHLLRRDRNGKWWFEAIPAPGREEFVQERLDVLRHRLAKGVPPPGRIATSPWRSDPSPQGHARAVQACRERIRAGDLYQANISLRLRSTLEGDPTDLFAVAVAKLEPDRAAFLSGDGFALASLSPELFLERRGRLVKSAPIKGTRARGTTGSTDPETLDELTSSKKDLAENTMIVDLVRNDLGRVCIPGSVEVTALAAPRAHPGVWHLVSEIEGRLRPGVDDRDLLAATFPPGSVTGAPKLAALEAISELESNSRQVFTGAIGFSSPFAGMELSVAIRTFEVHDRKIWLDAGGGIVADSDPDAEAAEAAAKARPLLEAIGGTLDRPFGTTGVPQVTRLGPRPMRRPRPQEGVIETMKVSQGRAVDLDRHLARLGSSVGELYGADIPSGLSDRISADVKECEGDSVLRVTFVPDTGIETELIPFTPRPSPVRLAPVTLPGGLGHHKWRDRRLLDELAGSVAPATPLLVDLDGNLLEAAWANVFVVGRDGEIATPPLDGRILPGVGRARHLARVHRGGRKVAERTISLAEATVASEINLVNSMRGILRGSLLPC